ncbi:MAG: hypothetical protein FWD42_10305, partial [Solirubrobacterales bacterium]|nr:hypothetical protein [Solirubrobacterales bacterium]
HQHVMNFAAYRHSEGGGPSPWPWTLALVVIAAAAGVGITRGGFNGRARVALAKVSARGPE